MIMSNFVAATIWKTKQMGAESFVLKGLVGVEHDLETFRAGRGRTQRRSNPRVPFVKIR